MTVLNTALAVVNYQITSGTITKADWDFLFEIQSEDDLLVILNGIDQTLNSDYTVVINGTNGGTITFEPAVVDTFLDGMIINIIRNLSATRVTSYTDSSKFSPSTVDGDMDRLTLLAGQSDALVSSYGMKFKTNYPFVAVEGYNELPINWPDGYALTQVGGQLAAIAINTSNGDPLLRGELAVNTGIAQGSNLVGYKGSDVFTKLDDVDVNTANIATNTTNIATNTTDISNILFAKAKVATNGTLVWNKNVDNVNKLGTGEYKITFEDSPPDDEYVPNVMLANQGGGGCRIQNILTTSFQVITFNASGTLVDNEFYFNLIL